MGHLVSTFKSFIASRIAGGSLQTLRSVALIAGLATAAGAQVTTVVPAPVNVGQQSGPVSVTVTIKVGGTAATPVAVTQGFTSTEFTLAAGGTCSAGTNYSPGATCTANVIFSPKYPGLRSGAVRLPGAGGGVIGTGMVNGTGLGGLAVLNPGQFDVVAGSSAWIYRGDGMVATDAQIFLPTSVVADVAGNFYISDSNNNRIRRVDGATQIISTVAGNGTPGYSGDGGPATSAMISNPSGLAIDGAGNIFFVDSGNNILRRIDAVTGVITTVAGTPTVSGYTGDNGPATSATLSLPEGLAIDTTGNLYIADTVNQVVRRIDAATGTITTFAGTGQQGYNGDNRAANTATLYTPWGLAFGPDGSLYIADLNNHRIRKVSTAGIITTAVGTGQQGFSGDGSAATTANLNGPAGIAADPAGNLYVADSGNNKVRKVYVTSGKIQTIVNDSSKAPIYAPYANAQIGPTWPAVIVGMYGPYSVFVDQTGNLYVSDLFENHVVRVEATALHLRYDTMRVGKKSPAEPAAVENDGNNTLTYQAPAFNQSALDAATTTCTAGQTLATGLSCNLGVQFAPTQVGDEVTGTMTVNSDAPNAPATITVSGKVLSVEPTTVALVSSKNPSMIGDAVTFTATVTSADTNRGGSVTFSDGSNVLCNAVALNTNGIATCTVSNLTLGQHVIVADYSGDDNNASAQSAALTQTVLQSVSLVLTASPNPAVVTQTVTLTLQASAATGTPTGAITFYDGTTVIGTANLNGSGVASISTNGLTAGAHSLSATYAGDNTDASGTSNIVSEQINRAPTTTTLSTSNASVPVGGSVTFTATVIASGGPAPTGTVTFKDGAATLGTGTVSASGVATFTTSALAPGSHSIVASYSGDTNDDVSSSAALTETVQQLGTTTTLVSDANPSNAGAIVNFTATVAIAAGATPSGAITGTVTFTDGSTTLGTATLDANGKATLPVSGLSVGGHAIVATYNGNTNYASSASPALSQQVQSTATTTTLSATPTNSLSGKTVTLTASVTSTTGGVPTGTVRFLEGSTVLGTGTLNAQGIATYTTSTLSVGSHNITAVYVGDSNYTTSTSAPAVEIVALATTGLTLAGPSAPVDAGTTVTFTTTLTGNGVAPTGTLTLKDGATVIGSQNVTNTGTFTFTSSTLSVGTHTLTATYAGDANNSSATSNTITITVQQAVSTTTLTSSLNPAVLGQNVTFTSQVTSSSPNLGGTVTFMDGANSLGSVTLPANGIATFSTSTLTFGQHSITAVYSGDTNHSGSTSPVLTQSIVQPASAAIISSLNPSVSGNSVTFTARITGVGSLVPTGNVTFTDGAATLGVVALDGTGTATFTTATLSVGSHTITVSYPGDTNYAKSSASLIQTVSNADTTIMLTGSANPAVYGAPLTLTAAIKSNGGVATGTVTFTDGGKTIGTGVLDANGVATLTTSALAPGTRSIVATYAGDGKAGASASTPLAIVVKQVTSVAVLSSANPVQTLTSVTFTATVTNAGATVPTGTVTFTDGTVNLGTATLDATGKASVTVTSLTAGNHPIQASYVGDDFDFTSVSPVLMQGVNLRPTSTTLSSTQTNPANPLEVTLISVVHWNGTGPAPTGKVTFKSGTTVLGSTAIDASGVATLTVTLASQTQTIVASYEGDTAYAASDSIATTITGSAATQFTMTIDPPNATLQSKQRVTVNLTLASVKDFADTMQFGCLGLPYAATCTFSQTSAKLTANGTLTVQVTVDTGDPLGAGEKVASNAMPHANGVVLAFLPVGLLAGFVFLRGRKKALPMLLLAFFAVIAIAGITGCSGLQYNGTPAGTYAIKVTAAGAGTGTTQSANMTLTVK